MLLSGKIDQQKLAQIDDQVVKLANDLLREKLKLRRDRLAALTPEQIERIADWRAEKAFRSKMHKGTEGKCAICTCQAKREINYSHFPGLA